MSTKNPELSTPTKQDAAGAASRALKDYYTAQVSRHLSNVIRRDVLTGRAKFGVSDDGKELYQLAMAKAVRPGDWRADYYRGHTLLLALGLATVEDILAQLYADSERDPFSHGRQMVGHHATPVLDEDGNWLDQTTQFNVSSATSPTAGQMARGMGLAFASKIYRAGTDLPEGFSRDGNEISWSEIGDASTSEGVFWETMNAVGVLQVPLVTTVVDDGYGISVPVEKQTTKASISKALAGLQYDGDRSSSGIDIHEVKGWVYTDLLEVYATAARRAREEHRPQLIHVTELTQPNGHSTSGSHERYKSAERLLLEKERDCIKKFEFYLIAEDLATRDELGEIEKNAKKEVMAARKRAWSAFTGRLHAERDRVLSMLPADAYPDQPYEVFRRTLGNEDVPLTSVLIDAARRLRLEMGAEVLPDSFTEWLRDLQRSLKIKIGSHLLSESSQSTLQVPHVPPTWETDGTPSVPGYKLFQKYFTAKFAEHPELYAFGEDVGKIGDVNQGFAGLQERFGDHRVFDTGIREWTIIGQAMGMAMRGLRPIAEVQYLDYIYYALAILTDDVATLRWRSAGQQACPLIIRTRGHRLEGVWHSGSYLAPLISSLRGIHLCVPRDAIQAIGMYNTLLAGDDPGIVIEVLNGYRSYPKRLPTNLTEFTVPLGVPECVRSGTDLTVVTYGACVKVCTEAAEIISQRGVEIEVIDVQTLLPFDVEHRIVGHLSKTNRLLIVDEDAPGATSAYLRNQILEVQRGYFQLDAPIKTLTAAEHRPAYGDDGDYVSKPQAMDVVEAALELMTE